MADNIKTVQAQTFTLAGSGVSEGDIEMTLNDFQKIDGTPLTITDFGTKGFGTNQPAEGMSEEQISFSGVTLNGDGTATLTGIHTVSDVDPYTEISGFAVGHAGGTSFVISNTSGYQATFANKLNDETITGTWLVPDPTLPTQIANKEYVDDAIISGGVPASPTVPGISMVANSTDIATGNDQRNFMGTPYYVFVTPSEVQSIPSASSTYGDGSDGAVLFDGTTTNSFSSLSTGVYTLTRDFFALSIVGSNAISVNTNGFTMYCSGTVTQTGTFFFFNNGGIGGDASGTTGGSAGSAASSTTVPASAPGQIGKNGSVAGTNGVNGTAETNSIGSAASVSGTGAAGAGGTLTAIPGAAGVVTSSLTGIHSLSYAQWLASWISAVLTRFSGNSGNPSCCSSAQGTAGIGGSPGLGGGSAGSGANGGWIVAFFKNLVVNSTVVLFQVKGGHGGHGGDGTAGTGGSGAGGGGAGALGLGGNGGVVILVYSSKSAAVTYDLTPGANGTNGNPGAGGPGGGQPGGTPTWTGTPISGQSIEINA